MVSITSANIFQLWSVQRDRRKVCFILHLKEEQMEETDGIHQRRAGYPRCCGKMDAKEMSADIKKESEISGKQVGPLYFPAV